MIDFAQILTLKCKFSNEFEKGLFFFLPVKGFDQISEFLNKEFYLKCSLDVSVKKKKGKQCLSF